MAFLASFGFWWLLLSCNICLSCIYLVGLYGLNAPEIDSGRNCRLEKATFDVESRLPVACYKLHHPFVNGPLDGINDEGAYTADAKASEEDR